MSTEPTPTTYLEMTIHMEGGVTVVAAVDKFSTTKNGIHGLTGLNWTDAGGADLPSLHHVNLDQVLAITSREIERKA